MTKSIIEVHNLSKKYRYGQTVEPYYTLRDTLTGLFRSPKELLPKEGVENKKDEFWALKDVSFKVNQGEALGVIGPNGSGKSTLLKILSRITPPTSGNAILRGRVASLLEVGTGFHQELSGRENIYLNGAILGMSRREIKKKFDEIVDFSGIEKFLDTPVKRYSSGMMVRLGFAVAAHLDPEILLIDEVLAVGDFSFKQKCQTKMNEISKEGRVLVYVSHDINSIKNICNKAILLKEGKIVEHGNTDKVIKSYMIPRRGSKSRISFGIIKSKCQLDYISLLGGAKENIILNFTEDIMVRIGYSIREDNTNLYLVLSVVNSNNDRVVLGRDIESNKSLLNPRKKGSYKVTAIIPGYSLAPGKYELEVALVDLIKRTPIHLPDEKIVFTIKDFGSVRTEIGFSWISLTSVPVIFKFVK